jgi:hypothetical protein
VAFINNVGAYTQASDRRLKNNITPINNVLDNLLKLNPVEYYYNHAPSNVKSKGFIAQEVQEIFPELVSVNEEGMLAVQYVEFGVIAIKAIQEQQLIIQNQQAQIDALMEAVKELKSIVKKDVGNTNDTNVNSKVDTKNEGNYYKSDADQ